MEVRLKPGIEARLQALAVLRERLPEELIEELVEGAVAEYFDSLQLVRETLDTRYDDSKSGRVQLIDGEEAFARLRAKSEARKTNGA